MLILFYIQGLKKGIVEIADIVVITKADGDLLPAARRIQTEYLSALKLIRRALNYPWRPRVRHQSTNDIIIILKLYCTSD